VQNKATYEIETMQKPMQSASADVVIVGAGIAGISTAYYLAQAGLSVVICEKGRIACEQSSRALGWIASLGLDPLKMELAEHSKRLWRELADALGAQRLGYCSSGLVHLCRNERALAHEQGWLDAVRAYQTDARILSASELKQYLPGCQTRYVGALYQASDARIEPEQAMQALAQTACASGVKILIRCAVRGFECSAGQVSEVVTEQGRIRCSQLVLAGGVWCRLFCGNAGIFLPQLGIHSSLLRIAPLAGGPAVNAFAPGYAFRQTQDGGYVFGPSRGHRAVVTRDSFRLFFTFLPALRSQWRQLKLDIGRAFFDDLKIARRWALDAVSPFERMRILDPEPDTALNLRTLRNMVTDFPAFKQAKVLAHWAGMIDATPDSVPVISSVPDISGLYLNTGYSAYGLTLGLAGGKLLSELMTGKPPSVNPRPWRYSRFTDGSPLRVSP